ncbi:MAG: hypothetical protein AMXMBFR84_35630 [Candidatus Hydrogenedentota bacterium]
MFLRFATVVFIGSVLFPASSGGEEVPTEWPADLLDTLSRVPVQDGGRIKPMGTYARFQLLKLSGRYTCKTPDGRTLSPLAWWLDTVLFPGKAKEYKVFLVENAEVLDAIGVTHENRRDRYSYVQLLPGKPKLMQLGQQYAHIDAKERTLVQSQLANLASNFREFEFIASSFEWIEQSIDVEESEVLKAVFSGSNSVRAGEFVTHANEINAAIKAFHSDASVSQSAKSQEIGAIAKAFSTLESSASSVHTLAIVPPVVPKEEREEWYSLDELALESFHTTSMDKRLLFMFEIAQSMREHRGSAALLRADISQLHGSVVELATARGEYETVPLEAFFYRSNVLKYSQWLFTVSLLLVFALWVRPHSKTLWWGSVGCILAPLFLLVAGIIMRCFIRGRPPVSTLYESILFITAVSVTLALFIEFANRRRIAVSLGSVLGLLGMFLAGKYEMVEGVDTMPTLIAVLDTNFWLSTHVTTITIGYAAGLVASAIAHVYLFGKAFGLRRDDTAFYAAVSRMVYGVICFGLLFSAVGTILGGIWANESWGRFWGWDPKENGALMIVLWGLAVLHARMGGYIRQLGLSVSAVFGGIIVAFSWFGVNLLGVGLHSYGFTSGIATALFTFYLLETLVLLVGAYVWLKQDESGARSSPSPGQSAASGAERACGIVVPPS